MAEQTKPRPVSLNLQEIEILKKTFASSDGTFSLLKSIRNLFFGFPISSGEADVIKSVFKDKEIREAFRKKIYPILSPSMELGEELDFWSGTETDVFDKSPTTIYQSVASKQMCLDMLEKAFKLLIKPDGEKVDLSYRPKIDMKETDIQSINDAYQIGLIARNKYLRTVSTGLSFIKIVAGMPNETPEQAKQRILQNSSK